MSKKPKTWGDVFWRYVRKGYDRSAAAHMADQWEARQEKAPPK